MLGKKYVVMIQPWSPPESVFLQPCPVNSTVSGPGRYATNESMQAALIAELYEFVPDHLHELKTECTEFATCASCLLLIYYVAHFLPCSSQGQAQEFAESLSTGSRKLQAKSFACHKSYSRALSRAIVQSLTGDSELTVLTLARTHFRLLFSILTSRSNPRECFEMKHS